MSEIDPNTLVNAIHLPRDIRDRAEWWIVTLDNYIIRGDTPEEALANTVSDYAYVFHGGPVEQQFSRAAEVALKMLKNEG